MKNIALIILLSLLASPFLSAKYITTLNGPGVEVTRVFVHKNGAVSLYIEGATVNLDNCTSTYRVYIPHDLPGKEGMLSVALFAYASGKNIGIHGSGCDTTPFWGGSVDVPIVDNLWAL